MFYITVKNGLLENGHRKRMGSAVWLFLWLLDKMTIINHEIGEGKVLGGKPIKYKEIAKDLEIPRIEYTRWIKILTTHKYIVTKRTPYGLIITVHKAFKVFNQKVEKTDVSKTIPHVSKMIHHYIKNDTSNIDSTVDNTIRHISKDIPSDHGNIFINELYDYFLTRIGVPDKGEKANRAACAILLKMVKKRHPEEYAPDYIKKMIDTCIADTFLHPQCTSFKYLTNNFLRIRNQITNPYHKPITVYSMK